MVNKSHLDKLSRTALILDQACKTGTIDDKDLNKSQGIINQAYNEFVLDPEMDEYMYLVHETQGLLNWVNNDQEAAYASIQEAYMLTDNGMLHTDTAMTLLSSIPKAESKSKIRIPAWAISIVSIVIVYAVINGVLVGGQKLLHAGDQAKLDDLTASIESSKSQLDTLDSSITAKEEQLTSMKNQMDAYNNSGQVSAYNALVDPYNLTRTNYQGEIDIYNAKVSSTNEMIDEATDLADSIGSTYYIVPIPTGKH